MTRLRKRMPEKLLRRNYSQSTIRGYIFAVQQSADFGQLVNWIAADIVRIKDGILVEHWDMIQDEVTQEQSKSDQPMVGDKFAA